jgi:hypothetical protein
MISVYTELLEHNHKSHFDEESAMRARIVRDSVGRLEVLVRDLLMYSRAIHDDRTEPSEIDSGEALLKYRSTETPRIIVAATRNPNGWIFSVKDNGIGISADYHDKIFIPFKRLHGQQYPGSGVGLAVCRRILERVGGRIWVDSELGHGATFYFSVRSTTPQRMPRSRFPCRFEFNRIQHRHSNAHLRQDALNESRPSGSNATTSPSPPSRPATAREPARTQAHAAARLEGEGPERIERELGDPPRALRQRLRGPKGACGR